jgi:hypothetical protein
VINAIKFSIEEIEASDQYFDHMTAARAVAPAYPESYRKFRAFTFSVSM